MNPLFHRLEDVEARYEELNRLLMDPAVASDRHRLRDLSREHSEVAPIVDWGASGGSAGTLVDGMAAALLPNGLSATSRNTIVAHIEALEQSEGLADPERIYEAGALILSAPDFMRH